MLHWGSFLLKQLYNLGFKSKENWPKKEELLKHLFRNSYQNSFRHINPIQKSLDTLVY